jgi:Kdo2-lipid IVA lauroyltransferase/acyltransferase
MIDDRPLKKKVKYNAIYWFVRFLIFISNILPRRIWLGFCGWLGAIAYVFASRSKERTTYHLGLAFSKEKNAKEINTLSKEVYRMLGKNAADILRATRVKTLEELNRFLVVHGFENYEKASSKGKGVIFLTCHLGAFDLQITYMALRGLKPLIIGTVLKDPQLNQLLWEQRNAHGAVAVERGKETIRLIKNLKSGGSLAILIDQDTKVKSRFVDFFGMPAATPVGAAIFAMKTGAAVVPTYIHLGEDGKQHMHLLPEIPTIITNDDEKDMIVNTQAYTRFIEDTIRQHPAQWVWMHERWKTKPGEEIL